MFCDPLADTVKITRSDDLGDSETGVVDAIEDHPFSLNWLDTLADEDVLRLVLA